MFFSLKYKIATISVLILIMGIGSTTFFNSIYFSREYSKAIYERTLTLGKMLKDQLDSVLKYDIPLNDLVGFEEQCQSLVENHKDIIYAMVVNTTGEILFHNYSFQQGHVITDSAILKKISSQKQINHTCTINGDEYRDFIIPVLGKHGEHIGAVRVGLPSKLIADKTKSMILHSFGFAAFFLCFCIVLLVSLLNFWISKPFRLLVSSIHDVRTKGTTSCKLLQLDSKDEIGQLASGFNQMVVEIRLNNEKIDNHMKELEQKIQDRTIVLEQTNEQLKLDIQRREEAEENLVEAYNHLRSTQAQLIQSSKLASIGELASGIAHELNQPLTVIRGSAQLLLRNIEKGLSRDYLVEQMKNTEKNTKRMMNIINHLRSFSRHTETHYMPVDINQVINDCFMMIGEQLRLRNIELIKMFAPDLPKINGNYNQLEQVFLNMISNARDAVDSVETAASKRIEIVTQTVGNGPDAVDIIIKDTGVGISGKSIEKVFDPFYTTKEVGKGTGLGLSISYGIVKDHGGDIWVSETSKDGTTFVIRIPFRQAARQSG
jgi:signal transduction histidine kinase